MDKVTTVDLLRHGEVEGGECFRGWQDDPLTPKGWQQMYDTVATPPKWQHIISSPLQRCATFAAELSDKYNCPVEYVAGLREMSFGGWEGKTTAELLETDKQRLELFWQDPLTHAPPSGENAQQFAKRVLYSWAQLLESYQGQHILLVTHAGVIRVILTHILNMPLADMFRLHVPYACGSRLCIYPDGFPSLQHHASRL